MSSHVAQPLPFACDACSYRDLTSDALQAHYLEAHLQSVFVCEQCSDALPSVDDLVEHAKQVPHTPACGAVGFLHTCMLPFQCGLC